MFVWYHLYGGDSMKIQTGYIYHIKDEYFDKIKDKMLEELKVVN